MCAASRYILTMLFLDRCVNRRRRYTRTQKLSVLPSCNTILYIYIYYNAWSVRLCVLVYIYVCKDVFVCIGIAARTLWRRRKNLIIDVFMFSVENENIGFLLLPVNVYRYQRPKDDRIRLMYLPRWLYYIALTHTYTKVYRLYRFCYSVVHIS